jgi:hypothetical protein
MLVFHQHVGVAPNQDMEMKMAGPFVLVVAATPAGGLRQWRWSRQRR